LKSLTVLAAGRELKILDLRNEIEYLEGLHRARKVSSMVVLIRVGVGHD
jgi:hypothetical protein